MNNKNDEDQIRSRGELDDVGLPSCVVNLILGYGFFPWKYGVDGSGHRMFGMLSIDHRNRSVHEP